MKKFVQNRNSRLNTRIDRTGKLRTETVSRDDNTIRAAISTHRKNNSSNLYVDFPTGQTVRITGREARTLYRLLDKHYSNMF